MDLSTRTIFYERQFKASIHIQVEEARKKEMGLNSQPPSTHICSKSGVPVPRYGRTSFVRKEEEQSGRKVILTTSLLSC